MYESRIGRLYLLDEAKCVVGFQSCTLRTVGSDQGQTLVVLPSKIFYPFFPQ